MKARGRIIFALLSCGCLLGIFRDALWGRSLMAPLDIAPALFSKYHYAAPSNSGVPRNHFLIDQLSYDLPLQWTAYHSWRSGTIPWWDPYTYGGRPFLADAHANEADPIRLACYFLFGNFVLAYNWTLLLHSFLGGAAMFWFLRRFGFRLWPSVWLGLAYQFSGYFALYFGHPWLAASFLYYPALWIGWDSLAQQWSWRSLAGSSLCVALIFFSGNLQSHAYLLLFGLAFAVGYQLGWRRRRALGRVALSGGLGFCLAAPVLLPEIEFFFDGVRSIPGTGPRGWLSGIASLSAVLPWTLGSFRTLDLGKFLGQSSLGFNLYIGSIGVLLAGLALFYRGDSRRRAIRRTAIGLVLIYFVILSTPLLGILYTRAAGLAAIGLTVLAAISIENWEAGLYPKAFGSITLAGVAAASLSLNAASLILYPKLAPKVRRYVLEQDRKNPALDAAPALREFQANNLPRELSFENPELFLACLSLAAFGWQMGRPVSNRVPFEISGLLALNLAPVLLFYGRFTPKEPVELWHKLLQGGPEQIRVASVCAGKQTRLYETAPGLHSYLFPNCFSHLFRVRTVHGYSALRPHSLFALPPEQRKQYNAELADYFYFTRRAGDPAGLFSTNRLAGLARFHWRGAVARTIAISDVTLNKMRVSIGPGEAGQLLWADTYFPGWTARAAGNEIPIEFVPPCFSLFRIPSGPCAIELAYRPAYLGLGCGLAAAASLFLLAARFRGSRRGRASRIRNAKQFGQEEPRASAL